MRGIGEVTPGTDLAETIATAAPWLRDGDVLVVTSKIVSKAEGRLVSVPTAGPERDAAREAVLRAETARPVARRGEIRIVATHHGFVMASAGIDASNVDPSALVLLPKDPDASARSLRQALRDRHGLRVAVIISDTMGRPWRNGLTDVAIGVAGLDPIDDYRGRVDAYGNELQVTQVAVADELCAAAELVKGKTDGVPVAVVRGFRTDPTRDDGPGAAALVREASQDLFSLGTAEARAYGLRDAAALADAVAFRPTTVDDHVITAAVASVTAANATFTVEVARGGDRDGPPVPAHATHVVWCSATASPVGFGADVHRLRCALAAEGLATVWLPDQNSAGGLLAVGAPVEA